MADLSMLITTLAQAKGFVELLVAERDRQKAAAIHIQLTDQITKAQLSLLEAINAAGQQAEALAVARERVRQLEAQQRERERYQLVELAAGLGIFGYGLRPAAELAERANEPAHFLCQPCFDTGRKAVLIQGEFAGSRTWRCPVCSTELTGDRVADARA